MNLEFIFCISPLNNNPVINSISYRRICAWKFPYIHICKLLYWVRIIISEHCCQSQNKLYFFSLILLTLCSFSHIFELLRAEWVATYALKHFSPAHVYNLLSGFYILLNLASSSVCKIHIFIFTFDFARCWVSVEFVMIAFKFISSLKLTYMKIARR